MNYIKSFVGFNSLNEFKSGNMYDYGCVMLYVKVPFISNIQNEIDQDDLYEPDNERYGLEKEQHITVLYGLHKEVTDQQIREMFSGFSKREFDIKVNAIDCFFNKEYDVLKMSVESDKLRELNKIARSLPHTNEYPDYKPHITIAYLKPGRGKKYMIKDLNKRITDVVGFVYSKSNGDILEIEIN